MNFGRQPGNSSRHKRPAQTLDANPCGNQVEVAPLAGSLICRIGAIAPRIEPRNVTGKAAMSLFIACEIRFAGLRAHGSKTLCADGVICRRSGTIVPVNKGA
jgi:hypothetical protein